MTIPALNAEALRHVTQAQIQLTRPARFRGILPIDGSVPIWATSVEHSQISMTGPEPVLIGNGTIENLPRAAVDKARAFIGILSFGYAYGYADKEVTQCQKLGIQLPSTLATANSRIVEQFLDGIAAGRYFNGTGIGTGFRAYGLPGLLNNASVVIMTASTKNAGGTAWTGATFDEIVADVSNAIGVIEDQTLENREADLVIMSPGRLRLLKNTRHPVTRETAFALLQSSFPGVTFRSWQKTATADAAGTGPRMVVMARGNDVARMIIPQELTDDTPLRKPFGWEIGQQFSTAGVLVEDPSSILYVDGI